jgi:predicted nucleic acid-binding protein
VKRKLRGRRARKYEMSKPVKLLSRKQIEVMVQEEVLNSFRFKEHVKEVSFKTNIHEEIVRDILKGYFTNMLIVINTVQKIKTKINIIAFCSIIIEKGKRI